MQYIIKKKATKLYIVYMYVATLRRRSQYRYVKAKIMNNIAIHYSISHFSITTIFTPNIRSFLIE